MGICSESGYGVVDGVGGHTECLRDGICPESQDEDILLGQSWNRGRWSKRVSPYSCRTEIYCRSRSWSRGRWSERVFPYSDGGGDGGGEGGGGDGGGDGGGEGVVVVVVVVSKLL